MIGNSVGFLFLWIAARANNEFRLNPFLFAFRTLPAGNGVIPAIALPLQQHSANNPRLPAGAVVTIKFCV